MTDALHEIAAGLRAEGTVISDHVTEPTQPAVLGPFTASGPRCSRARGEYALVVESVREGYLLHYGTPRMLAGLDDDLALLAGDHLYALGLERLAALGDLESVRELADLISLCALLAAEGAGGQDAAASLWLASATAIAVGGDAEHEAGKSALRRGETSAAAGLAASARRRASAVGLEAALGEVAEAIESRADGS